MTICNMSIEGGARVGYVNPDRDDVRVPARPAICAAGRRVRRAAAWWRGHGARTRRAHTTTRWRSTRTPSGRPSRGASTRASRSTSTSGCRRRPTCHPTSARASPKRSTSWGSRPAIRSKARRSTSRSSARAPTPGCPICARPRASSAASTFAPRVRRWSCRDRRRCGPPPSAKGSTACSSTPASSGAAPAARCAWR